MATINIFGVVGEDVRAADIIPKIQAEKGDIIEVGIMSVGGDVREGLAIYDALREASANGQEVKTFALGITASIASIIFMAGDVREVSDNAEIMIHNASTGLFGNKHELKEAVEFLDSIDDKLISVYVDRTDLSIEDVTELVNKETFMSADEAVNKGFATDKTNVLALVAMINKQKKEPVKMATEEETKKAGFFAHMAEYFNREVKAEADDEKEDEVKAESDDEEVEVEEEKETEAKAEGDEEKPEEEAKAEEDDDEKEEMRNEISALKAELETTKAKAEGDEEEKKDEEAKAELILAGITDKKVTMHQATNLFKKSLSDVTSHLSDLSANATGRGKTKEPKADASGSKADQWNALKAKGDHRGAQKLYNKYSNEISSEMNEDK